MTARIAQQQLFNKLWMIKLKDVAAKTSVVVQVPIPAGGLQHEVSSALAKELSRDHAPRKARTIRITSARPNQDLRRHYLGCKRNTHNKESSSTGPPSFQHMKPQTSAKETGRAPN
jgi:hypothetical protein